MCLNQRGGGKTWRFNLTAALVWQLCDGSRSMAALIEELELIYPHARHIGDDVDALVKQLIQSNLLFAAQGVHVGQPIYSVHFGLGDELATLVVPLTDLLLTRFNVLWADSTDADLLFVDHADFHRTSGSQQVVVGIGSNLDGVDATILVEATNAVRQDFDNHTFLFAELSSSGPAQQAFFSGFMLRERAQLPSKRPQTAVESTKKLTIGMATYDDYDGVYFSVQAIRLFHPEITELSEILIIDNNPGGPCAEALRALARSVPGCTYLANGTVSGTAVRDAIFQEAKTDYVLCIDSHVFVEAGRLQQLIDYFDSQSRAGDLLQGPLLADDLGSCFSHFEPLWRNGMHGVWSVDARAALPENEPFEIPMQGLGLFACRRRDWPGFNRRFSGFGGEEGYIHQKFRDRGGRTLCLPFLRWLHRFVRPMGTRYENKWEYRIRNYLIGFRELGLDCAEIDEHFASLLGRSIVDRVKSVIDLERDNPFDFFDAVYCVSPNTRPQQWQQVEKQFDEVGITFRVKRFSAMGEEDNRLICRALSHRAIVEQAREMNFDSVLVVDDDVVFCKYALRNLANALEELRQQDWHVCCLGGAERNRRHAGLDGCDYLERQPDWVSTQAVAYSSRFYDRLLADMPARESMENQAEAHALLLRCLQRQRNSFAIRPYATVQAH